MIEIDEFTLKGGSDIYLEELDLHVKQPKLRSICDLGEKKFYGDLGLMLIDGETIPVPDGKAIELSPYMMLVHLILVNPKLLKGLNKIAELFFNKHWAIDDETLQLKLIDKEEIIIPEEFKNELDAMEPERAIFHLKEYYARYEQVVPEQSWENLCDVIREISGVEKKVKPKKKAKSKKAQEILDKLAKAQEKIDKGKQSQGFKPFLWDNISTLSTGDKIPVDVILDNYTILQLTEQLKRCINKDEAEKQFSIMLQGVKLDKPMSTWIGNLNKN